MADVAARRRPASRDERIAELRRLGWSLRQIGAEVHLSPEGVRQVLLRQAADDAIDDREAVLLAELGELLAHVETRRHRIAVIRRELRAIAEERESRAIDRLNGL